MPELPEVEILTRHLRPLVLGKRIRKVEIRRARVIRPSGTEEMERALEGARFEGLERRGKYLLFTLRRAGARKNASVFRLLGHLGMTGRMHIVPKPSPLPRHTAVALDLGNEVFVLEDTRYFGRFTLDTSALDRLGPEPLEGRIKAGRFRAALRLCRQPIKVKLLDQALIAGVGNIYASEALFLARISPRRKSCSLTTSETERLLRAIRRVLSASIRLGSTVPLNFGSPEGQNRLFYYGRAPGAANVEERLLVYDRAGSPCTVCGSAIRRLIQAGRSTYFCEKCQARSRRRGAMPPHPA